MKLDRNVNPDGTGKYALVNFRKAKALTPDAAVRFDIALGELMDLGVVTLGNESPGDQFFVMKYKDRFTCDALRAYAVAASDHAVMIKGYPGSREIGEFADDIFAEVEKAAAVGKEIPT
jgi:hypothetical protein